MVRFRLTCSPAVSMAEFNPTDLWATTRIPDAVGRARPRAPQGLAVRALHSERAGRPSWQRVLEGAPHRFALGGPMFPQLTAAIADIAAFMDDDEGPNFGAARQQAVDAYSAELLPTALGGEWTRGQPGVPWPDQYASELFDHPLWFRRRDARGPRTWQDCVVLGSPYRWEVVDETGEPVLDFL